MEHKPDLAKAMEKRYGKNGAASKGDDDEGDSDESEYEMLGNKIKTALKSEDGLQIAHAVKALVAECMKTM